VSTTTRAGFVVPVYGSGDTADNITYYDNNITQFEAETATPVIGALPGSGNFEGRVKSISYSGPANYSAPGTLVDTYVRATVTPNAQNWIRLGTETQLKSTGANTWNGSGPGPAGISASGPEVFQTLPCDGAFTELFTRAGTASLYRFTCQVALDFSAVAANVVAKFTGAFNIFINPNPQDVSINPPVQPTPTTPGVTRLSFPIWFGGDSVITNKANGQHVVSGELFWTSLVPQPTWPTTYAFGISAYLSATQTNGIVGVKYDNTTVGSSGIYTEDFTVY
jgi:hypothetical protein